jgi:hypothetical protein
MAHVLVGFFRAATEGGRTYNRSMRSSEEYERPIRLKFISGLRALILKWFADAASVLVF